MNVRADIASTDAVARASEYRPDIDGLRAIAVLSVVLFHLGVAPFSGGFVGVDVFFVVSGYLITGLLWKEVSTTGTLRLGNFFLRRLRRLFPALFTTIALTLLAGAFIYSPLHIARLGTEALTAALSTSNILFWSESGYFDTSKQFKALLHTWSLGVEEQFYLVWPFLILVAMKVHRLALPAVLGIAAAVSLYFAQTIDDRAAAFFLTPFRIYEFAIGAALVWLSRWQPKQNIWLEILLLLGMASIGYSAIIFSEETHFPGLSALVPTLGAGLAIFAGRARYLGVLLRNAGSVFLGKISYSLYLVHWPIIILYSYTRIDALAETTLSAVNKASLLIVSVAAAVLLWKMVEQPFRKPQRTNGRFLKVMAASFLAIGFVSSNIYTSNGWSWRLSPEMAKLAASPTRRVERWSDCYYGASTHVNLNSRNFERCSTNVGNAVLVIGDSHAGDLGEAIWANAANPHVVRFASGGCRPYAEKDGCLYEDVLEFTQFHKANIEGVIFTQKGSYFLTDNSRLPVQRDSIDKTIDYLENIAATGVPVIWVGPQWEPNFPIADFLATAVSVPNEIDLVTNSRPIEEVDDAIAAAVKARGDIIEYISRINVLGPLTTADFIIDNEFTYSDTDHWSGKGEEVFGRELIEGSPTMMNLLGLR